MDNNVILQHVQVLKQHVQRNATHFRGVEWESAQHSKTLQVIIHVQFYHNPLAIEWFLLSCN
ncbi:hypothetical protein Hanom_Chr12g01128881 [Helianthus anomalus]